MGLGQGGGHLVVLPQYAAINILQATTFKLEFRSGFGTTPSGALSLDTVNVVLNHPNKLSDEDWAGWVVPSVRHGALRGKLSRLHIPCAMPLLANRCLLPLVKAPDALPLWHCILFHNSSTSILVLTGCSRTW